MEPALLSSNNNVIISFLLLPISFIYILVCIKKPFWVIVVLAVYLPFEEFILKWVPDILYTPLRFLGEATILLLLGIYVVDRVFVKKKWLKTPIDLPVLFLLFAIILSTLFNQVPLIVAVLGVKNLLRYIALFYLVILVKPSEQQILKLIKLLFSLAILHAAMALLQAVIGKPAYDFFAAREVVVGGQIIRSGFAKKIASGSYRTMVFGTMGRYNVLGNYLAMWLGIAGAILISRQRILKVRIWHIILLLIALILTYSRMSWIAFLVGGIFLFALSKKNKIFACFMITVIITFTLVAGIMIGKGIDTRAIDTGLSNAFVRYLDLLSPRYLETLLKAGRGYSYFSIVPAILQVSPLLGLGPGMIASDVSNLLSVPSVIEQLNLNNPYAVRYLGDAGFATIVAQLGLWGLIAVILIFIQLFRVGFRFLKYTSTEWHPLAVGYIIIVIMMAIFNMASFALIYRVPSYYFWMFSAFIVLQNMRIRDTQTAPPKI